MAQFCTRCGKPLSPDACFCAACGGAVVNAAAQVQNRPASATPSQQAAQFTPVTASLPRDPVASAESSPSSSIADKWTTVAAPVASELSQPSQSSQFAPVDVPSAPPESSPSPAQGWSDIAPVNPPASNGWTASPHPGSRLRPRPCQFLPPLPISNGPRQHHLHRVQTSSGRRRRTMPILPQHQSSVLASRPDGVLFCRS